MKKYRVILKETIGYVVDVEAEDADAARQLAEEMFVQDDKPYETFNGEVEERVPTMVWEDPPNWTAPAVE